MVAEPAGGPALICLNKGDLGASVDLRRDAEVYRRIGYPVIWTSAEDGTGLVALRQALAGKVSAFVGPSGIG